jgi:cytochrome c oxidase subunit 3
MPGTTTKQDIELIIETKTGKNSEQTNELKIGGDGGGTLPPAGGDGGGGDNSGRPQPRKNFANRYYTGMAVGIVSILMFFMALAGAFLVRRGSIDWVPVHLPLLLWINTAVLLASSATIELARRRLAASDQPGFKNLWLVTTILGVAFLLGQLAAWRQLAGQGIYLASNPASSFFYIFTATHALHLVGGVCALLFVALRDFDKAKITRPAAAEIISYYWHFLDALWLFLLALLYAGR